jgi:hypothetical protein
MSNTTETLAVDAAVLRAQRDKLRSACQEALHLYSQFQVFQLSEEERRVFNAVTDALAFCAAEEEAQ